jgi:phage shock protein A
MTKNEALKMAIEALEDVEKNCTYWEMDMAHKEFTKRIQACKDALERPTNMVAVPADQLEKMQKELKRLRKKVQEVKDKEFNRSWGVFS